VAGPVRGEGPVRLVPDRELAVKQQRPVRGELGEVKYGRLPQPTRTRPSSSTCMLPWLAAASPAGAVISAVPCGLMTNSCRSACRPLPALMVAMVRYELSAMTALPSP
jgi:hypothetical protein